jgi:hypothetical protein
MKLANDNGEELALADLELIRGGAGIRFFRSETELAKLGRGLQRYASGLPEPLDSRWLSDPGGPRPVLLEPRLPDEDEAFELSDAEAYVTRQPAR